MTRTRIEVPCSPEEKAAWEAAAGEVAVARWVRGRLNEAAAEHANVSLDGAAAAREAIGVLSERGLEPDGADREGSVKGQRGAGITSASTDTRVPRSESSFRPDFGKRLKS